MQEFTELEKSQLSSIDVLPESVFDASRLNLTCRQIKELAKIDGAEVYISKNRVQKMRSTSQNTQFTLYIL